MLSLLFSWNQPDVSCGSFGFGLRTGFSPSFLTRVESFNLNVFNCKMGTMFITLISLSPLRPPLPFLKSWVPISAARPTQIHLVRLFGAHTLHKTKQDNLPPFSHQGGPSWFPWITLPSFSRLRNLTFLDSCFVPGGLWLLNFITSQFPQP